MKLLVLASCLCIPIHGAALVREQIKEQVLPLLVTPAVRTYLHLEANGTRITKVTKRNDTVTCEYFTLSGEEYHPSRDRGHAYFDSLMALMKTKQDIKKTVDLSIVIPSVVSQNTHHSPLAMPRRFDGPSIPVADAKEKE